MPVHFYWGDDDFRLQQAISTLKQQTLDPAWASFNYEVYAADGVDAAISALNQAMTPPFGQGQRLVWLQETSLGQRCPESILAELERTLPQLPKTTVLLLTSRSKPDGRAKFLKLIKQYGDVQEFATIPPWKTDQQQQQVRQLAKAKALPLAPETIDLLTEAIGSNTRQLDQALDKLALYWGDNPELLPAELAAPLITASNQTSLKLAATLKQGDVSQSLSLVSDLLAQNEPALRIVATLVNQFRTWLWVKLMVETGERSDTAIATAAEVGNPKRVYFLQKEVRSVTLRQLQKVLPLLLELESALKQGQDEQSALQTKVIEIGGLFRRHE